MSDSSNSNMYGTPNKKKRNELHDASDVRFQSPHNITSVAGVGGANNTVLGSPEVGTFMSVFMSPMTQYQQMAPDSKDWTPGIQHKLTHESFLNFPDAVTPGGIHSSLAGNGGGHQRHSLSNLHLGMGLGGIGVPSSGGPPSGSLSLMSPLFPDLLDSSNNSGHHDFGQDAHNNSSLLGGSNLTNNPSNSNHFAQNAEALKNRLNKRKSSSSSTMDSGANGGGLHLSSLEDRSTVTFANNAGRVGIADMPGSASSDISGIAAITAAAAFMPLSASNSLETSPEDKHRLAEQRATVGSAGSAKKRNGNNAKKQNMAMGSPQHQQKSGYASITSTKSETRMDDGEDDGDEEEEGNRAEENDGEEDEDDYDEDGERRYSSQEYPYSASNPMGAHYSNSSSNNHSSGNAGGRSFMSPEMQQLSMRAVPSSSSRSAAYNNNNNNNMNNVMCNCKKSKCLKMYCDCFRLSEYCKSTCNCVECCNIEKFDQIRLAARKSIQDRNPEAFKPRVKEEVKEHLTGCHCRKSACLKKYCECYTGKVPCSNRCRCVDCQNIPQLYAGKGLLPAGVSFVGGSSGIIGGVGRSGSGHVHQQHPYQPPHSTSSKSAFSHLSSAGLAADSSIITTANAGTAEGDEDGNNTSFGANSTSPSAAIAALATLSASKVSANALLDTTTAQPVTLFGGGDDEDTTAEQSYNHQHNYEYENSSLSIDIPGKPAAVAAVFHVTQSPELRDIARRGQHTFRDPPHPALDTVSTVAHGLATSQSTFGTFSVPQSPVRSVVGGGTLSAVVSPQKLLDLAAMCEPEDDKAAALHEIPFPTHLFSSQESISRSTTATSTTSMTTGK